jgi:hypothetical protein
VPRWWNRDVWPIRGSDRGVGIVGYSSVVVLDQAFFVDILEKFKDLVEDISDLFDDAIKNRQGFDRFCGIILNRLRNRCRHVPSWRTRCLCEAQVDL